MTIMRGTNGGCSGESDVAPAVKTYRDVDHGMSL
jgi:hypothetical protein